MPMGKRAMVSEQRMWGKENEINASYTHDMVPGTEKHD